LGVQPYGVVIACRAWVYFYMTYYEKLKDPRWQRKRLEVFERDNFTCTSCNCAKDELQLHHLRYCKGQPWDISNEYLTTLCKICHKKHEEMLEKIKEHLAVIQSCSFEHLEEVENLLESVWNCSLNPYQISVLSGIAYFENNKFYERENKRIKKIVNKV